MSEARSTRASLHLLARGGRLIASALRRLSSKEYRIVETVAARIVRSDEPAFPAASELGVAARKNGDLPRFAELERATGVPPGTYEGIADAYCTNCLAVGTKSARRMRPPPRRQPVAVPSAPRCAR